MIRRVLQVKEQESAPFSQRQRVTREEIDQFDGSNELSLDKTVNQFFLHRRSRLARSTNRDVRKFSGTYTTGNTFDDDVVLCSLEIVPNCF